MNNEILEGIKGLLGWLDSIFHDKTHQPTQWFQFLDMEIRRLPSPESNQTFFGLGRVVWVDGSIGGLDLDTYKTNDFGQKNLAIFCETFSRANHFKKPPT